MRQTSKLLVVLAIVLQGAACAATHAQGTHAAAGVSHAATQHDDGAYGAYVERASPKKAPAKSSSSQWVEQWRSAYLFSP